MKKAISVILCLVLAVSCFSVASFAKTSGMTYYVDNVGGNSSNDGLSESTPFASAESLRNITFHEGDRILFKAGGIFECDRLSLTCSGTESDPIVISSYGEGVKPLLTTNSNSEILCLIDCSYVTVSNLEFTAKNGGGIWIDTLTKESSGITLDNLTMHDITNTKANNRDNLAAGAAAARACVMVKGLPSHSRFAVNDLTVTDCEMYDCGNGISIWGSWNDQQNPWCKNEEDIDPVFNKGVRISGCYFHDMDAESIIVGMCDGALVENCSSINCCLNSGVREDGSGFCNAAMWFWGSVNSTFSHCEIAGQKCLGDGMTCDFDSYTHYSTYEFIYSHDNIRFVGNCPMYSGHKGNTIRYCLSVNDNVKSNNLSQFSDSHEIGLKFYNNTIVNPGETVIDGVKDGYICDNIFYGKFNSSMRWARNKTNDATGEKFLDEFTGTMKNNCFWGSCVPSCAEDNIVRDPLFAGNDFADPDSFRLSVKSPLIGKGITKIEGQAKDIYGNDIGDVTNIGCYAGKGEENAVRRNILSDIWKLLNMALGIIYQGIVDLNNIYIAL